MLVYSLPMEYIAESAFKTILTVRLLVFPLTQDILEWSIPSYPGQSSKSRARESDKSGLCSQLDLEPLNRSATYYFSNLLSFQLK